MTGSTTETPVLDLLASMTADSLEASSLDAETLMLVRIAALAADPDVKQKSGKVFASWTLANEYGFTDADGSRPDWGAHFAKTYGGSFSISGKR